MNPIRVRRIVAAVVLATLLLVAGYVTAGVVVYQIGTEVIAHCELPALHAWAENRPDMFVTGGAFDIPNLDTTPYRISNYETVTFPSRDEGVTLQAWYAPAAQADAPAVVLVHGQNGCRRAASILLPAGMLHRAGFTVLLIDMRNHGDSQITTGRMAGGITEYRDVLGAWDWLVTTQGIPPERIGLLGTSLGAASVMIAAGEEPQVAAVWEDSSYASVDLAIQNELARRNFPTLFGSAAITMGRVIDRLDLTQRSPLKSVPLLKDRPVFITHGEADTRMPVLHAHLLIDALQAEGAAFDYWLVPGSDHVHAVFDQEGEYEIRLVDFFQTTLGL